eukprot:396415-Amphidinium_carterae.1
MQWRGEGCYGWADGADACASELLTASNCSAQTPRTLTTMTLRRQCADASDIAQVLRTLLTQTVPVLRGQMCVWLTPDICTCL